MRFSREVFLSSLLVLLLSCEEPKDSSVRLGIGERSPQENSTSPKFLSADLKLNLDSLPPEVGKRLKNIKVLRLTDNNIASLWQLGSGQDSPSIVIVDCTASSLSTSRVEALVAWAKGGHGLFIQQDHASLFAKYLLPESEAWSLGAVESSAWSLVSRSDLLQKVEAIKNFLWCSTSAPRIREQSFVFGRYITEYKGIHLGSPYTEEEDPAPAFARAGESFIPVLGSSSGKHRFGLFASTWQGARLVWYAETVKFDKQDCVPQYDDVRLWANIVFWLAGAKRG